MHTVRIITVGRIKKSAKYLEDGIQVYEKRMASSLRIEWVEIPEETATSTRTLQQVLEREAEMILKQCGINAPIVVLSEHGSLINSQKFADWLFNGNPLDGGRDLGDWNRIIFIIGGANGTSPKLNKRADHVISLSLLTFPHQVVRLLLVEQIYRALSIHCNEPYHKE